MKSISNKMAFAGVIITSMLATTVTAHAGAIDLANVSLPVGDWLSDILKISATAIVGLGIYAFNKYAPATYRAFISDKVVGDAINYALASIEGAVSNKTVAVSQLSGVVATSVEYLVTNEPRFVKFAGDTLEPLIIAQLSKAGVVPPEATAEHFKKKD